MMNSNYDFIKTGVQVWWSDPDRGQSSGKYEVCRIYADNGESLEDDTTVLISDGFSEAEVPVEELQTLDEHILEMEAFVDTVRHIAEKDGWDISGSCSRDSGYIDFEFEKYSSMGLDFGFNVECKDACMDCLVDAIEEYYEGYDPDYEAYLWIGDDGHGKNGAPYHIKDIVEEMEECEKNISELMTIFADRI